MRRWRQRSGGCTYKPRSSRGPRSWKSKGGFPSVAFRASEALLCLAFRLVASRKAKEYIFVVRSHSVRGDLLPQSWKVIQNPSLILSSCPSHPSPAADLAPSPQRLASSPPSPATPATPATPVPWMLLRPRGTDHFAVLFLLPGCQPQTSCGPLFLPLLSMPFAQIHLLREAFLPKIVSALYWLTNSLYFSA